MAGVRTNPFESPGEPAPGSPIDGLVFAKLRRLGIKPGHLCSDAVFVRRVHLDMIGTLPTAPEVVEFLQDRASGKRAALIHRLFSRDEFADYWAMKWSDLLRVKAEFPINLWPNAVQAYHHWIRSSVKENKPYDQFVRAMLTASGSNFRVPEVNFYRAVQGRDPKDIARAVALTFLGTRAENWPAERLAGMAVFFSQIGYKSTAEWKEEIVFWDRGKASADPPKAVFPDGTGIRLSPDRDPRAVFADWLVDPKNSWFTRAIVNRVWSWLLGRGIIHEPDDIRPDNPPVNPELLTLLERELVSARHDLKHLYRLILTSKTYQLSSIPRTDHQEGSANFSHYPLRRLEAEVLIDALCQITGTTEKYSSPIPEPFTFIPEDQRSIALADGSITSSFLELFGRPPRDSGLEGERNNRATAAQRLHLLNSSHIQRKIEQAPLLRPGSLGGVRPRDMIERIYLTVLSRYPTDEELETIRVHSQTGGAKGREPLVDLTWALVNSAEFLYRH
ncbi:MAG TPA: DUF1553 domain-containing protein [Phycisphaerae bacterium]|nr:DUF1553 domain-containing protein [Phycisphaerae bacterium]HRY68694.1 DUF1553 domain-containing protein [Phycisphaerae bacterium]HSA25520.1 DUF1553 domain-containing protein [Phycisphaerae bacterium]